MASTVTGKCLCGVVSFKATLKADEVGACHCGMCRRSASGPLLVVEAAGAIELIGRDHLTTYASSDWAERAFCKTCGSNIYWRLAGKDRYWLSAGALVDAPQMQLATELFIDDKPAYYEFAGHAERLTGEQAIAAFAASE